MRILRDRARDPRIWVVVAVLLLVGVTAGVTQLGSSQRFAQATATLSIISGQVEIASGTEAARPGVDDEGLPPNTTVRTVAPDGRAVLTFRDGSTIELEPEASVAIEQLALGTRGELIVVLRQDDGTTWSYVQPQLSPYSRFHIRTPFATAVVRGTKFEVDVDNGGPSGSAGLRVSVFEGRADLVLRGRILPVPAGHETKIVGDDLPVGAERITPQGACMRIEVTSEALVTVTDPHGRSAGVTPKGVLSQIPGAIVTGPQDDPQAIEVFSPAAGNWEIGIVPRDDGGPLQLLAITAAGGEIVDQRALTMTLGQGQRAVTGIRLEADGRSGSFAAPVQTTATRAVALPSGTTTTAPLPQARLFEPTDDPLALSCVPAEELQGPRDVKPVPSPEQTSGR